VTKRLVSQWFALKEVTNQLQRSRRLQQCLRGNSDVTRSTRGQSDFCATPYARWSFRTRVSV